MNAATSIITTKSPEIVRVSLIATGDITDDTVLDSMGAPALGLITSFHYSADDKSPENGAFKKAYVEANGTKLRPNFMAAAGYDGMALIYEALKKTNGSTDGEKLARATCSAARIRCLR